MQKSTPRLTTALEALESTFWLVFHMAMETPSSAAVNAVTREWMEGGHDSFRQNGKDFGRGDLLIEVTSRSLGVPIVHRVGFFVEYRVGWLHREKYAASPSRQEVREGIEPGRFTVIRAFSGRLLFWNNCRFYRLPRSMVDIDALNALVTKRESPRSVPLWSASQQPAFEIRQEQRATMQGKGA